MAGPVSTTSGVVFGVNQLHISGALAAVADEVAVPNLDMRATARWNARQREDSPWLHEEVGRRMAERLGWIKQPPTAWLHWAPVQGGLNTHQHVVTQYPKASVWLAGEPEPHMRRALQRHSGGGWNPLKRWLGQGPNVVPASGTLVAPVQMLWANMALHQHAQPKALLARWRDWLAADGFLMFSCLGPDTLREVRAVYAQHGWPEPHHPYTDMHDWGDMLVETGFAEPVMDMERLTLTYPNAERLLQDLREGGRNCHTARFGALRGKCWHQALLQALEAGLPRTADGQLQVTVEVIYGHAFRGMPKIKLAEASSISMQDMRTMLRQPPPGR